MRRITIGIVAALALFISASAKAQDYSGKFQGPNLSVEITAGADGVYAGTIQNGGKQFPLKGQIQNGRLAGTFISGGNNFPFIAALDGDKLTLQTGTATYSMQRQASAAPAPVNPLDTGNAPATPAAAPAAVVGDYKVLAATASGKTIFKQQAGATSAQAALKAAAADLAGQFDDKPQLLHASADQKDKQAYGSFSATLKGKKMQGLIMIGVGADGADVTVMFAAADAPKDELNQLFAALPQKIDWQTVQLAGGSGTLKIPADWKLVNSSPLGAAVVEGPAGQRVGLGQSMEVVTPDSFIAKQVYANATMLVGPYSDPATALKNLMPQLSRMSQKNGGPATQLENIISNNPAQALSPNGQAAILVYTVIQTTPQGQQQRMKIQCKLETYPVGAQGWAFASNYGTAPEATFDRDAPIMIQIARSWQLNDANVQNNSAVMINNQKQRFAAFEDAQKQKSQAFDQYMQSVQDNQKAVEKTNADFDEVIRGVRTVEDTQTGERHDVDLGWSNEIVNGLNQGQGYDRYIQIPLRDQQ